MLFLSHPCDHQHFSENPFFTNKTLTKSYVLTSGPTRGLTASELVGRPRPAVGVIPSDIGTTKDEHDKEVVIQKPGKPEGEWDTKTVVEGTGEKVKQGIAFFDEMDDLVGLVSVEGPRRVAFRGSS